VQPVLFDTSVYISSLRQGEMTALTLRRAAADSPIWLSAVVLEELYAGSGDHGRRAVARLERDFDRIKRVLVPNLSDWAHTGEVLSRLAAKYDYEEIGQGRLTNDALIAVSAGRLGIRIVTRNERDFRRLAEFGAFQWEVAGL